MSIASEITRLQTSKADIKTQVNIDVDDINEGTDFIDEETLDDYADLIEDMQEAYKQYIPINSTSDTQIEAPKGGAIIGKTIKGNTLQDGTPTPSSPVEVNNVTGEQVVRVCGKNLFELYKTNTTISKNGIDVTRNNDGTITLNGTTTANTFIEILYAFQSGTTTQTNIAIPLENTKTYTLSINQLSGTTTTNDIRIAVQTNISDTQQVYASINNPNQITNSIGLYRGFLRISSGRTLTNLIVGIQLEQGTSVTTYEPYQGKDYEVNLGNIELNKIGNYQDFIRKGTGKNLFDNNADIVEGYTFGATNNLISDSRFFYQSSYIPVLPNTSYCIEKPSGSSLRICEYQQDKTFIQRDYEKYVFTTTANTYFIRISDFTAVKDLIQLEQGTTATYYEPYGYKDQWYIEKNVGKKVLNGSENWEYYVATSKPVFFLATERHNIDYKQQSGLICYSNYYLGKGQAYSFDNVYDLGNNVITFRTSYTRLVIRNDSITSVADFQSWLNTHNTSVYYVLNTPEYTLIENEELIEQLEKMMPLLEGQNNISVDGSIPVTMDLDYIVRADRYLIGNRREGK